MTNLNIDEIPEYYRQYAAPIAHLPLDEIWDFLDAQVADLRLLPPPVSDFAYAEGKWTAYQVLQHLIDTERIFGFRAVSIARKEQNALPGFDHDAYAAASHQKGKSFHDVLEEWAACRKSHELMFRSFDSEMLQRSGKANGVEFKVIHLAYIMVGHGLHHSSVLMERYQDPVSTSTKK
jgi:hypothetical protein